MGRHGNAVTDLIAASVVASSVSLRGESDEAAGHQVNSTECPFSLVAFALGVNQRDKRGRRKKAQPSSGLVAAQDKTAPSAAANG